MTKQTYVYFIKPVGMDGPIKIGCSATPAKRLIDFSTWSPFPLELIGQVPGGFTEENFLHRRFAAQHTHREWFLSTPVLREKIDRILAGESIKSACQELVITGAIRNQARGRVSDDRKLFLEYGKRIRVALKGRSDKDGTYRLPLDVHDIIEGWRSNGARKIIIVPTADQIARLEQFLSHPSAHLIFIPWGAFKRDQSFRETLMAVHARANTGSRESAA